MDIELSLREPSKRRVLVLVFYAILIFLPIYGLVLYATRDGEEYLELILNSKPESVDRIDVRNSSKDLIYALSDISDKKVFLDQISSALPTDIIPRRGEEFIVTYHIGKIEVSYRLRESKGKYWMLLSSDVDGGFDYGTFLIRGSEFGIETK